MVSFLSWECSDQSEASEGITVPVPDACRAYKVPSWGHAYRFISRRHHPRKRMIQYPGGPSENGETAGGTGYPGLAGYDRESPACFPALLAPNKDREIG